MIILTLNCGSSSLKYQVYDWEKRAVLATGIVERIALDNSVIKHQAAGKDEYELVHTMSYTQGSNRPYHEYSY